MRRNRVHVTAAALVLLALLLGVAGTTLGLFEARRQERIADEQRQSAEKRAAQVTKMNDILGSIFQDLNPENAQKEGKPLTAVLGERLDRATAEIEGEAIGDPLAVARMQMTLGDSQFGLSGIGGSLAAPPLPHHRAYGSVHGGSIELSGRRCDSPVAGLSGSRFARSDSVPP